MILWMALALGQTTDARGPNNLSARTDDLYTCRALAGPGSRALEIPQFFKKNQSRELAADVDVQPRTHAGVRLDAPDQDIHFCVLVGPVGPGNVKHERVAYVRQLFVQSGVDLDALLVVSDHTGHADALTWMAFDGPPKEPKRWAYEQTESRKDSPASALRWVPGATSGSSVRLKPKGDDPDGDGIVADACPGLVEDFDGLADLDGCPEPGTVAHPERGVSAAPVAVAADAPRPRWPSIDEPLVTDARNDTDAAVVIGLEDYAFLPDVPYAHRDADAVRDLLVSTQGIPPERVTLLQSGGIDQIRPALQAAGESVGPDGRVWVYYAGHGAAHPDTHKQALLGDDTRADPTSFQSRGLPVEEVLELAGAGGGQPVVILDACFTGVGRGGDDLTGGQRFAIPSYALPETRDALLWSATGPGENSGPIDDVQHGAFTYFVVGALRGWADADGDGTVAAKEAQDYVSRALRARQLRSQTPTWTGASDVVLVQAAEEGPEL